MACKIFSATFKAYFGPLWAAWSCGQRVRLPLDRPQFDPEPRHLPVHRVRRMRNIRLDFFGKNHRLNKPYPTHGNNMSSERSGAHHCIDGKGRLLEYRSGQTLPSRGYMCISMYTYRLKPKGQGDSDGHCYKAPYSTRGIHFFHATSGILVAL